MWLIYLNLNYLSGRNLPFNGLLRYTTLCGWHEAFEDVALVMLIAESKIEMHFLLKFVNYVASHCSHKFKIHNYQVMVPPIKKY